MDLKMTKEEREAFLADVHVGVISIAAPDRAPLALPIWYDYTPGGDLWVITNRSSQKGRLIEAAGRFSLCAQAEALPYKYVSVEGEVGSIEPSDVERDLRPMARRYLGEELGDLYVVQTTAENESGDSVVIRMRPRRWLTVDYAKQFGQG
jgi:general stress protein 26